MSSVADLQNGYGSDTYSGPVEPKDNEITASLAAAAFGESALERQGFDMFKLTAEATLSAIDSLLGRRDYPEPFPLAGGKGYEIVHSLVQHIVVPSACQYVFAEMGNPRPHQKPLVDGKLRAELYASRAMVKSYLAEHEFFGKDQPKPKVPEREETEAEKKGKEMAAEERAKQEALAAGSQTGSTDGIVDPQIDSNAVTKVEEPKTEDKPEETRAE